MIYMNHRQLFGAKGEAVVSSYLQHVGYILVAKNIFIQGGEIDLIMLDRDNTLCFIEVKSRRRVAHFAERSISYKKKQALARTAKAYCTRHGINPDQHEIRFDVVVAVKMEKWWITHYKGIDIVV